MREEREETQRALAEIVAPLVDAIAELRGALGKKDGK